MLPRESICFWVRFQQPGMAVTPLTRLDVQPLSVPLRYNFRKSYNYILTILKYLSDVVASQSII
jgi:hypothetical protein